jgi:hypothetical protein
MSHHTWVNTILELTCKNPIFLWRSNWSTIFGHYPELSGPVRTETGQKDWSVKTGPKIGTRFGTGRLGN